MAKKRADERKKHNITVHRTDAEWKALCEACMRQKSNPSAMVDRFLYDIVAKATPDRSIAPIPTRSLAEATLTREQVDPAFDGTATQFARTYGYINLHTKSELEQQQAARRGESLLIALRITMPSVPNVARDDILAWVQEGEKTGGKRDARLLKRIREVRATVEVLMPLLDDVEGWINAEPSADT